MLEDGELPPDEDDEDVEPIRKDPIIKKKIAMRFDDFINNRDILSTKNVVKTYSPDFEKNHFCQKDIREHTGCINAVQVSHGEKLLATGGDDLHCRVWRFDDLILQKTPKPITRTIEPHDSNIFSIEFDLSERCLYSGERSGLIMKHEIETGQCNYISDDYRTKGDVYDLDHHPFDSNLVVATYSRLIALLDDRDRSQAPIVVSNRTRREFYTAKFHPESPVLLLTASEIGGPIIIDRRYDKKSINPRDTFTGFPFGEFEWMGAQWSPSGNQFVAIRKAAPPVYFDFVTKRCFILKSSNVPNGYRNRKTIKSLTFIDDYTVATGSDHWGIHIWRVPRPDDTTGFVVEGEGGANPIFIVEKEIKVLRGHRSIPNQVRYSKQNKVMISSGVENSFKLWSPFRLPWSYDRPFERRKRAVYRTDSATECDRERVQRHALEQLWDEEGEMDGRQCFDDVFKGNANTAEDRATLEMFDVEDDSSEDEQERFHFENEEERREFDRLANRNRLLNALNRGEEHIERFLMRMGDDIDREFLHFFIQMRRQHIMEAEPIRPPHNPNREPREEDSDDDEAFRDDSDEDEIDFGGNLLERFLEELDGDEEEDDEEVEGEGEKEDEGEADDEAEDEQEESDEDVDIDVDIDEDPQEDESDVEVDMEDGEIND